MATRSSGCSSELDTKEESNIVMYHFPWSVPGDDLLQCRSLSSEELLFESCFLLIYLFIFIGRRQAQNVCCLVHRNHINDWPPSYNQLLQSLFRIKTLRYLPIHLYCMCSDQIFRDSFIVENAKTTKTFPQIFP